MPRCSIPLLVLLLLVLPASAQDPPHRRYTMQEGMPSNMIYAGMQDHQGFMWFGTDAGAVRFDGTHIDRFGLEEGLTDEDIFAVATDREGRKWFLPSNGRPCSMQGQEMHTWRTDSVLAGIFIRSGVCTMAQDDDGVLWFGGLRGEVVKLATDGRLEQFDVSGLEGGIPLSVINFHRTSSGGVQVFNGRDPVLPEGMDVEPWMDPTAGWGTFRPIEGGRLMHCAPDRVEIWRDDHWEVLLNSQDLPGAPRFYHALLLDEDELWVTLRSGGVLRLRRKGDRWEAMRDAMFCDDMVVYVVRDSNGNIWLSTTYGGVILIAKRDLGNVFYGGQRGGREEFMRAYASPSVGVWLGTNQGDIYWVKDELQLVDIPPDGPTFSRVTSICSQADTLLVGSIHSVYRLVGLDKGPRMERLWSLSRTPAGPVQDFGVKALTTGPEGRTVGSSYGLFDLLPRRSMFTYIDDTAIPLVRIYAPHIDARGCLWFEENDLPYVRCGGAFKAMSHLSVGEGHRITAIASIADTLFFATNGRGIHVVVNDSSFGWINTADGLSSDHVQRLFVHDGELFAATENGADVITGPWSAPRAFQYVSGPSNRTRSIRDLVADDAHVYVLFSDGLMRSPRNSPEIDRAPPVPYVRLVRVNDEIRPDHRIVGIRGRKDRLLVDLGAILFDPPGGIHLQYRIDEGDWLAVFGSSVDLSGTPSGDHVLQVRAAVDKDHWSLPVSMEVIVIPPYRERWWAMLLVALSALVAVLLVHRILVYQRFRKRERELRQREAVALERQRLAMDLHDDLGAELSSLLLLTRTERERPSPEAFERVEEFAAQLTDKVKEVIWTTAPSYDNLESTLVHIQRHMVSVCGRHGLRLRINIPPTLPLVTVSAGTRRALFLIVKEAMNNVVKHARATTVSFRAVFVDGRLEMEVGDDGMGMGEDGRSGSGQGLHNMKERAGSIGGTLSVHKNGQRGLRLVLRVPLDHLTRTGDMPAPTSE